MIVPLILRIKVIGFDTYRLTNIFEKTQEWISYTIIDDEKNRIWLGWGTTKDFFVKQWLISEAEFRKKIKDLPINSDLTGIANISFEGDQGYSAPSSEIIWFDSSNSEYDSLILERFLERNGDKLKPSKSYYHLAKILKDFKVI